MLKIFEVVKNVYQILYNDLPCGHIVIDNEKKIIEQILIYQYALEKIQTIFMNEFLKELGVNFIMMPKSNVYQKKLGFKPYNNDYTIFNI